MSFQHASTAQGSWSKLSLAEQLGNIGSEVGRAASWEKRDPKLSQGAAERALELFDLSLDDSRWHMPAKREIARAREVFCDAMLGGHSYSTSMKDMERYFFNFTIILNSASCQNSNRKKF